MPSAAGRMDPPGMTDDHGTSWLGVARDIERELEGCPLRERSRILEAFAEKRKMHLNTVRRSISAYEYVRAKAPSYGVALKDVQATLSSIETIKSIAKQSPGVADDCFRVALLGKMSYSSLRGLREAIAIRAADAPPERMVLDIDALTTRILDDLRKDRGSYQLIDRRSAFARALEADLEFAREGAGSRSRNVVAIYAPGWDCAIDRGTVEKLCIVLLASVALFARTYYVVRANKDWVVMEDLLQRADVSLDRIRPIQPFLDRNDNLS